ncbi:MAG: AlpA family phage regulatory protein [Pseudomonadota bacterium]
MSLEGNPVRDGSANFAAKSRLITDKEVADIIGCSRATVWRRVADGTLPQPLRIGGMTRWVDSEISGLIEQAMADREVAA